MLKLLKEHLSHSLYKILWNVFFVVMQIATQIFLLMPEMKNIIDYGVADGNMEYVLKSGLKMLLFTVLTGLCTVAAAYFSASVTAGTTSSIRSACFKRVESMSSQEFDSFGGSTLMTRTMADVTQLQIFVINIMRNSLIVPIIIVCMLVLIFFINKVLFLILGGAFALTVGILIYMGRKSKPLFENLQVKTDRINLLMGEKLRGVRTIRAFCNQDLEANKTQNANQEIYDESIAANSRINFLAPIALMIMNWSVVLIYMAGTQQLKQKMLSISDLLLVFQYTAFFITSLGVVPLLVNLIPKVFVASKRINELLDSGDARSIKLNKREKMGEEEGAIQLGEIEFCNVIFGYSGASDVVADMNFKIAAGKTTAIIGATGSGKTTLMNLLVGLYRPTFGEIRIDGYNIQDIDSSYLRSKIAYAPQKSMVFQDTVRNNICAYDKDCTDERIQQASNAALFSEVVQNMPQGMDTVMSQGGMNISGGQRQRLSLARTLARQASIYIFDDSFSALDAGTEATVRSNISKKLMGKTILMVAQKISTIVDADCIIVLNNGKIAGQGTHKELLEKCTEYQSIYRTQCYMDKEEV